MGFFEGLRATQRTDECLKGVSTAIEEASGLQLCSLMSVFSLPVQSPSSTTPPIEICSSRLTKLMRRTTDKKSEFLKALKDDRNGEITENRECDKLDDVRSLSLLCHYC